VVTAPWMGGTRPPKESFEKGDEFGTSKVYGRNELLHERHNYLAKRIAKLQGEGDSDDDEETLVLSEQRELALLPCEPSESLVTVEARGGPLKLRGENLVPVLPNDGPWTFVLEFQGPSAKNRPFAFKATLKKASLRWKVSKLLGLFGDRFNDKYAGEQRDRDRLRLHVNDKTFASEDALLAELVENWTAPIAARLFVKEKFGAGTDATELTSQRTLALIEKQQLAITEWSTQEQIVKKRTTEPYKGPMTSQEIRDYWEDHKQDKHYRTDAALRGYATITDDPKKLEEWKKNRLVKNKGFLLDPATKPLYPSSC